MPYVKNAVSSLAQGVSQQAESQRHPSQAAEQINAYSSHVKGLVKRPPTKRISSVDVHAGTGGQSFVHLINRDADERYAIVINKGIRVTITKCGAASDSGNFIYYEHGTTSSHAAQFTNGQQLQFFHGDTYSRLPFGLKKGETYYVISHGLTGGSAPANEYRFEVSKTSGGTAVTLGQVEFTQADFGANSTDKYKAGLLYESVRINDGGNLDGEWIDGVLTIRFASPQSGSGHSFEEGDKFRVNRLRGTSSYILASGTDYGLTQKGPDGNAIKQMMGGTLSTGVSSELSNKFWIRNLSKGVIPAQDYGYFVDRDQLPPISDKGKTPKDRVGWHSVTSADKWVVVGTKIFRISTASPTLDYANLAKGQLMKIGSSRRNPRGIVINTGTQTIVHKTVTYNSAPFIEFAEAVTISTSGGMAYDDATAETIQLYYWASLLYSDGTLGVANGTQRRPLWSDYRSVESGYNEGGKTNWAYIGDNGAQFVAEGGDKATGPHIHDLNTGLKLPIQMDDGGTADALDYLLNVDNPATDLKAATVGDTTFLLNTSVTVGKAAGWPNDRNHEAFISIDSADYGKTYKVKIGNEAVTESTVDGLVTKAARCWLYGAVNKNSATRKIAMIRARKVGAQHNNKSFRLVQNWCLQDKGKSVSQKKKEGFSIKGNYWADVPPDSQNIKERRGCFDGRDGNRQAKAAIFENPDGTADMAVNFFWATRRSNVTKDATALDPSTVGDLMTAFNTTEGIRDDWEMVTCDNVGVGSDEDGVSSSSDLKETKDTEEFIFHKAELHHKWETYNGGWTPNYDWKNTAQREISFFYSAKVTISIGKDTVFLLHRPDFLLPGAKYTIGLQSPSIMSDPNRIILNRGECRTGDGLGTVQTTGVGTKKVYDGEFYYKSPKWTGNVGILKTDFGGTDKAKTQRAIGTERIAEMLASNARIEGGERVYPLLEADPVLKADGRITTDGEYLDQHEEECLGMSYKDKKLVRLSDSSGTTFIDHAPREWQVIQSGNIIAIRHPEGEPFDVVTTDDMGGNAMSLTFTEVSESVKLPSKCRHGHVVKVVGDAREEADDYYLRFEADNPDDTRLLEGRWVETVGYECLTRFDPNTMPVSLVRNFSDDYVTAANPEGKYFTLQSAPWASRNAGDDITNPFPSMVGKSITDIFLHKNRLGLIAGESVILSEAGEHYNLFRTTTAALLDTAPIDVTASTNMVSHLKHAIPFADQLIVFSEQAQFSITGDPYISPKTVQITATSHFSNSATAKPVNAGNNIFFAFKRSEFGAVSEYFKSRDQTDAMESKDISAHIPKYIAGNILSISSCPEENTLVCLTDDATQAIIYVYKYFTASDGSKTQSAWFKYVFGGANDRVLACKFIHNVLYLVIQRNTVVELESLVFEDSQKDTGMDYEILLDRRLDVIWNGSAHVLPTGVTLPSSPTPLYDTNTGKSTVTLPYVPEDKARVQVVRADGKTEVASDLSGAVAQFPIDLTGVSFYIGDPYTLEYTFSKPHLRKNTGTGGRGTLMGGRQQLTRGTLEFTNSRQFKVTVTHIPENTVVDSNYAFTGTELGFASGMIGADTLSEGFYSFGIMGRNDRVTLKVSNATPYPSDFLSLDYEGRAYARGNRWTG